MLLHCVGLICDLFGADRSAFDFHLDVIVYCWLVASMFATQSISLTMATAVTQIRIIKALLRFMAASGRSIIFIFWRHLNAKFCFFLIRTALFLYSGIKNNCVGKTSARRFSFFKLVSANFASEPIARPFCQHLQFGYAKHLFYWNWIQKNKSRKNIPFFDDSLKQEVDFCKKKFCFSY